VDVALSQAEAVFGEHHDTATLRRFIGERRELGCVGELFR
jgi:hypothetical protein